MRYFLGFLIFLSIVNLKVGVSNEATQFVIIFRAVQLLLKAGVVVTYLKFLTFYFSRLHLLFIAFVMWRVLNVRYEFASILLSVEFLVNILFLIVYFHRIVNLVIQKSMNSVFTKVI